jgi:hypothetical protein
LADSQLAAAAALATSTALLLTIWFPTIERHRSVRADVVATVNQARRAEVARTVRFRAVPLLAICAGPLLIFAIDIARILVQTAQVVAVNGVALDRYDSRQAALVGVYMMFITLTAIAASEVRMLLGKIRELAAEPPNLA